MNASKNTTNRSSSVLYLISEVLDSGASSWLSAVVTGAALDSSGSSDCQKEDNGLRAAHDCSVAATTRKAKRWCHTTPSISATEE